MNEPWQPPYPYYWPENDDDPPSTPLQFVRETLEWIGRPHGLTSKRCPKDERLREAEDMATVALEALEIVERHERSRTATLMPSLCPGPHVMEPNCTHGCCESCRVCGFGRGQYPHREDTNTA